MKAAARPGCTVTTPCSIVGQSDSAGKNSTAIYKYGPYGEPDVTTGSRFRYTGQQLPGPLNLYY